jgi:hypothetical protein
MGQKLGKVVQMERREAGECFVGRCLFVIGCLCGDYFHRGKQWFVVVIVW